MRAIIADVRKHRKVRLLSPDEMERLETPRLLEYRRKLLTLEESQQSSDWDEDDLAHIEPGYVYFKDSPRWAAAVDAAKRILGHRPNVD